MDRKVNGSVSNSQVILLISIFAVVSASGCTSNSSSGTLTEAIDGDTVEVRLQEEEKVRLLGIDSPELSRDNRPQEYEMENTLQNRKCLRIYAEKAEKLMSNFENTEIMIYQDKIQDTRGSYGRMLAYIYHPNRSSSLNRLLIEKGLARYYEAEFGGSNRFREAERRARINDRGLWSCS